MKKHKLLSISAVIMMLSVYGCSLDEFNPSGISTEHTRNTISGRNATEIGRAHV